MTNIVSQFEFLLIQIPIVIALVGLGLAWRRWRDDQLRSADVLDWCGECIEAIQLLRLICNREVPSIASDDPTPRLEQISVATSTLVEKGRMFFANEKIDDYGSEKLEAYRGYRPAILDCLVVCHQVSNNWAAATESERLKMRLIVDQTGREFVTLAQLEVGRKRAASRYNEKGGAGARLKERMAAISEDQVRAHNARGYSSSRR